MKKILLFVLLGWNLSARSQETDFEKTKALIRQKINCCAIAYRPADSIKLASVDIQKNGWIRFSYSGKKGPLCFNLHHLYKEQGSDPGFELGAGASRLLIFHMTGEKSNSIRFASHEDAREVYKAFRQLATLLKSEQVQTPTSKPQSFAAKSAEAVHFISRTSNLSLTARAYHSLRALDKKDSGDTTWIIYSRGEGWLDKDSLPTGLWQFYAQDEKGGEYLFKTGYYRRTVPALFDIKAMDSSYAWQQHRVSFARVKADQSESIPFIKSGSWQYFHSNGQLWKKVNYQVEGIPIYLDEVITTDGKGDLTGSSLIQRVKFNDDEWIDTEVTEYDPAGRLFKKLQYYAFSQVYKKTLFGAGGMIIREEKAVPYQTELSAEHH